MGKTPKDTSQPKTGKSKKKLESKSTQPTHSKNTPASVSFNESFFRALIEHNSNAITLLNSEGAVIYDSPAATGLLGYSPTEWIGKSVFELVHPDDLQTVQADFQNLLNSKIKQDSATFRLRRKDHSWIWIDAVATNLLAEPSVQAIVVNYRDVTETREADAILLESEERFRQVWDITSDAMSLSDENGIVIAANPAYYNLYGYTPEQVLGQSFAIIFPEDFREYALKSYKEIFKSDVAPTLLEAVVQRADGTERIVESRASFLTSAGQRTAMLSIIRDITERKQADEIIRAERNFSNHALDSLPGVFYMYDENRKFLRWNKNFETVTGYTGDEIAGMSPLDFFADKERKLVDEKIEETFRNGSAWVEANFVTKDGRRIPYYFTGRLAQMEDKTCLIGTGIDITERKRNQEKLQVSEHTLKLFVEYAPASIAMFDREMKYIAASKRYLLDYRLREQNIVGRSHYEVFPEVPDRWKEIHQRCLAGAIEKNEEDIFPREDGSTDWVRWEIHPWVEANDEIGGIILFSEVITERKLAQASLHESEERFRLVVEAAPNAMIVINKEGKIQLTNKRARDLFGYTSEEFLVTSIEALVPERFREHHASYRDDFYLNPQTRAMGSGRDLFGLHKDGSEVPIEIGLVPFESENGMLILASIIDITERKQSEASLRRVERRSQALIEKAPDGIVLLRTDGVMEFASPSAKHIFGYEEENEVGVNPAELTHPEDLNMVLAALSATIQDPSLTPTLQYRFLHKNGDWLWIESTFTNLQNDASVNAIVINFRDITKQKQADEQIQRQLKHLQALRDIDTAISNSFDLKLTLDILLEATLSQLEVSAAAVLLFNVDTSRLEYKAGNGFYTAEIEQTNLQLGEGLAGKSALKKQAMFIPNLAQAKEKFIHADVFLGEGFVSYYGIPLVSKGKLKGVLEVFQRAQLNPTKDWTDFLETLAGQAAIAIDNAQLFENLQRSNFELERRVAERTSELHKTNLELEHANRAKDEFLANMSHELRTPLNSILGLSESMLEQYNDTLSENQQRSLQIIESSGRHLLDLINDVLDLAKIEAGKFDYYPQSIHVNDLCKSSLIFVKTQAMKKNITLTYEIEDTISDFSADPRRLKQILVNLLTNAVKFTPNDGHVTLKVNIIQGVIQFSVIDTGIGIAPDDLRKLFTPFVQVDSSLNRHFEGTGLGLALVHKLTDLHGGSVEVESEVGKGSRFTIKLPYQGSVSGGTNEAETSISHPIDIEADFQPKIKSGLQKILLVEDNQANILTIGEYLENHGYQIVIANDGVQAIEKAQEVLPDVILMDIQMPILDGIEATRRLRADVRFAKTPIIALTALAMPGDRERCLEAGATEYMSKPVSLRDLRQVIKNFLILK